jgi:glycogen(starch) synthase
MRILFISNLFPPGVSGGFEIECRQVADKLFSWGHDVCILTTRDLCPEKFQEEVKYPVIRSLELFLPFSLPACSSMRFQKWKSGKINYARTLEVIEKFKPDVTFIWSLHRLGLLPVRAVMKKQGTMAWRIGDETLAVHVPSPFQLSVKGIYRWFFDRVIFPQNTLRGIPFDFVSSISHITKQHLIVKEVPVSKAQIHHRGILIEEFPLKNNPGNLSNPIALLYVGRLHPSKGVETLIKASHKVAEITSLPISLSLVGTGSIEYQAELQKLTSQGKAQVNFLGFIPFHDLSSVYRAHDIFIFPSIIPEGQGSTFLEAMCSGLPVISTNNGGQGELLFDGENALIFPKGNDDALVSRIIQLLDNESLRKKLAFEGRKSIIGHLEFDQYVFELEKFLKKAVEDAKQL